MLVSWPPGRGQMLCNYAPSPWASIHGYLQYSGRGRSANHPPPSQCLHTRHTTQLQEYLHSCKETSPPLLHTTTLQHYTTALMYIKLPMYLLFIWHLYLMVLRCATSLLRALEGVGPENLDFFGPKWYSLRSLPFQGPPLPMPLVMMLHTLKPLRTVPYKQKVL